ncbi:MAG: NTP transferase domain-containing protein [Bernardetiaceae bacterium]|nr:NTP transferase domain-containing protein [Bernardetiaceae bacterium]
MKIIVPMAGRGSRLRPHTLTIPKPLIPIAGKPIVERLVEDIAEVSQEKIEEVAFIIGDFGQAVEEDLQQIAQRIGAKHSIYHQDKPLGTAHAILCAADSLSGNVMVAFADTLFRADFKLEAEQQGVIWVKSVEDPRAFGVVDTDEQGGIRAFVEKPQEFVSDLAIIGIYYFKDGAYLRKHLQYLIDNDIKDKGEYQLTNALENMRAEGTIFKTGKVQEWLDCGNKNVTVETNARYLEFIKDQELVHQTAQIKNSVIIPPVFIGEKVQITNAVIGPHVSIGANTIVEDSIIKNSLIQEESQINNATLENSMIGNFVSYKGRFEDISIGDYSTYKR